MIAIWSPRRTVQAAWTCGCTALRRKPHILPCIAHSLTHGRIHSIQARWASWSEKVRATGAFLLISRLRVASQAILRMTEFSASRTGNHTESALRRLIADELYLGQSGRFTLCTSPKAGQALAFGSSKPSKPAVWAKCWLNCSDRWLIN